MSKKLLDRFLASTVAGASRGALDGYDYDAWKYLDIVEKGIALDAVMEKLRRRENDPRAQRLREDISDQVAALQDTIEAMDEVYEHSTKWGEPGGTAG